MTAAVNKSQARDLYLVKWFQWAHKQDSPKPDLDMAYASPGMSITDYEESLVSGELLLKAYSPLIGTISKAPPYKKLREKWPSLSRLVREPNAIDHRFPNHNEWVIQRELYAELQTCLLEIALKYDPTQARFSTYAQAALRGAARRFLLRVFPYIPLNKADTIRIQTQAEADFSLNGEALAYIRSVLTPRQWQVLELTSIGIEVTKVAELLGISQPAVSKTMKVIRYKLASEPLRSDLRRLLPPAVSGYGSGDII